MVLAPDVYTATEMAKDWLEDEWHETFINQVVGELKKARKQERGYLIEERGIYPGDECPNCNGLGVFGYSHTGTWHSSVGGQAFTSDVCDKCWGSGSKTNIWPSHKVFHNMAQTIKSSLAS